MRETLFALVVPWAIAMAQALPTLGFRDTAGKAQAWARLGNPPEEISLFCS
ncbi:hypothetical protein [Thermus hydrothermalis]